MPLIHFICGIVESKHAEHVRGILVMESQTSPTHSIGRVGTVNNEGHAVFI